VEEGKDSCDPGVCKYCRYQKMSRRVRNVEFTLNMCSGSFPTRASRSLHRQLCLLIVLDLQDVSIHPVFQEKAHTFVTLVPAKKNKMSSAKGRLHGWTACAMAERPAATMPAGVRDLCDHTR
jgi:hypothetical protein